MHEFGCVAQFAYASLQHSEADEPMAPHHCHYHIQTIHSYMLKYCNASYNIYSNELSVSVSVCYMMEDCAYETYHGNYTVTCIYTVVQIFLSITKNVFLSRCSSMQSQTLENIVCTQFDVNINAEHKYVAEAVIICSTLYYHQKMNKQINETSEYSFCQTPLCVRKTERASLPSSEIFSEFFSILVCDFHPTFLLVGNFQVSPEENMDLSTQQHIKNNNDYSKDTAQRDRNRNDNIFSSVFSFVS